MTTKIYYHAVPADWRKEQKYKFLDEHESVSNIDWIEITPDAKQNWLTAGMEKEFDGFISIANKEIKSASSGDFTAIFKVYSGGLKTNRNNWCFNFDRSQLKHNIEKTIRFFNEHVANWNSTENQLRVKKLRQKEMPLEQIIDQFVKNDDSQISWSGSLKSSIPRNVSLNFDEARVVPALYTPFQVQNAYFDRDLNERTYKLPSVFPPNTVNQIISVTGVGSEKDFAPYLSDKLTNMSFYGGGTALQCFPFYTYNEDGTNQRENITDWALEQFRENYADTSITKWDIFYYTYALLHHPEYREKYAANLKRELPRIPFAPDFWGFAKAGKELADIHVGYEEQPEYKLDMIENGKLALDWRVDKMKYNKDKTAIVYNDFLTIGGIPPKVHEYRLGNRSALDWIVDQYKVSIDKRSGITNDPNRDDDPQYIVRLIKKIVTVSLRTNEIVSALPPLKAG